MILKKIDKAKEKGGEEKPKDDIEDIASKLKKELEKDSRL